MTEASRAVKTVGRKLHGWDCRWCLQLAGGKPGGVGPFSSVSSYQHVIMTYSLEPSHHPHLVTICS